MEKKTSLIIYLMFIRVIIALAQNLENDTNDQLVNVCRYFERHYI